MDNQEFLRDWLKSVTKERGRKSAAAKAIGAEPSAITRIINGDRRLHYGEPDKIAKALKVPGPGMDDSIPEDADSRQGISTVRPYKPTLPNGQPVVSSALSAGGGSVPQTTAIEEGGIVYSADAILGEIVLPSPVSASISNAPTSRIHWFEVRGDSMEPTLIGGDWVGVNTTDLAIGQGGVFALRDDNGEILVKRLRRLRGDGSSKVEIISDNPRQGVDVEYLENIAVFGRIVARISRVG